jgi:serine/threonine protein kinase
MNHTESFTYEVTADGRRIHVKRPVSQFADIPAYRRLFEEEAQAGLKWSHPNVLKYLQYTAEGDDPRIAMEYVPAVTLQDALLEEPLDINTPKESRRIMEQIFEAVAYLHSQNVLHLDLRPENVLVTRSAHDVKLMNPASFYAGQSPSFLIYKERYSAPELFAEGAQPSVAADIYSLGRLMEYLFSYSTLTLGVQKVVRRATAKNPAKRYRSVAEMQKAFRKSAKTDVLGTLVKVAAVLLVLFFFYDIMGDDRSTADIVPPTEDTTYTRRPAVTPSNQAEEDPNALYSLSAIQEHIDTAYRNREVPTAEPYSSLESLDQNASSDAKRNPTVERLFKKEFRKRAEAMISKIYTRDMMNGDESRFLKASTNCFTELDRVQRELGEQYGMDLVQSTRLSSEVITELTEAYKSKIRR